MAKRLRDSQSYDDPFVRRLSSAHKHLWFYILDKCDHAGIWKVDLELAAFFVGATLDRQEAQIALAEKVQFLDEKTWFVPGFILFQYGALNESNSIHRSVLSLLKARALEAPSKAFGKACQGSKVKNKVKDKVKAKAKVSLEPITSLEISKSSDMELSADAEAKAAIAPKGKELRDYFWAEYRKAFGRDLTWAPSKDIIQRERALVEAQGIDEAKRLAKNYIASTFIASPTYRAFLADPDKYNVPMMKYATGPKSDYESKRGKLPSIPVPKTMGDHFKLPF